MNNTQESVESVVPVKFAELTEEEISDEWDEPPDVEILMQWLDEGGCEAPDGCWIEPDGVCPHGQPSWLRLLGLI